MPQGRPKGVGKSKLDAHQVEITALLKNGTTKTWIAKKYGTTRRNLSHWMEQHQIVAKPEE
jgi:transcriptional regulator